MLRRLMLAVSVAAGALALLGVPAALASEASDAYKRSQSLKDAIKQTADEAERAKLQQTLADFVKEKSEALSRQQLSKFDLMWLGLLEKNGGMFDQAAASLRKSLEMPADPKNPNEQKAQPTIHQHLIQTLAEKGDVEIAMAELGAYQKQFPEGNVKKVAMAVGMAARDAEKSEIAAQAFEIALGAKEPGAVKPLVNAYLRLGRKDKAVDAAQRALDMASPAQKGDYEPLLSTTKRLGEKAPPLEFGAFVPEEKPDLAGKVVVMGVWNVSARTLHWSMSALEKLRQRYASEPVVVLGLTTYYGKDDSTGKLGMPPDQEQEQANTVRQQTGFMGTMAFAKDEAALKEWGLAGLPHFVVVGKDGTLLFAQWLDPMGKSELRWLDEVIQKALGR